MNDQELRQWLHKTFDINPQDLNKYKIALTVGQYQILEFFGDSILGFIVSEYLVTKYSTSIDKPGWFNDIRKKLVKNVNLTDISNKINLASVVITNTSNRQQLTNKIAADILEALIAATYLDQGLKKCQEVIEKVFDLEQTIPKVEEQIKLDITSLLEQKHPISALQEFLAKKGESSPEYIEIARVGEPHNPLFTLEATCKFRSRCLVAEGTGKSKQEAKKVAAHNLLIQLTELYNKHF